MIMSHLKNVLAGRRLPRRKAWIGADWKKIFWGLLLCATATTFSMEKSKAPVSQAIQRMYSKEYQNWLKIWQQDDSVTNLAWYLSVSIYRDVHELEQRVKAGKSVLRKQIDYETIPFDTSKQSFKDGVQQSFRGAAIDLIALNLKIKHLEMLKQEVAEELQKKSKL